MSVAIERELEDSLASAISVAGLNITKSNHAGNRLLPSLTIEVSIGSEDLSPNSGVFKCGGTLTYSARADTTTREELDSTWFALLQTFYQSPSIESILTTNDLKVFQCKVLNETPGIINDRRIWTKTTTLDILCSSK